MVALTFLLNNYAIQRFAGFANSMYFYLISSSFGLSIISVNRILSDVRPPVVSILLGQYEMAICA
jgi:hypothetical protein